MEPDCSQEETASERRVFTCFILMVVFILLIGFFVEPTVFADVKDEHTIAKEEIFGPVMSILKESKSLKGKTLDFF
jgi:hypothetical protein